MKIKDLLFAFFRKYFRNQVAILETEAMNRGTIVERERAQLAREEARRIEAEMMVGMPVIGVSNEMDTLVVGYVTHIEYISQAKNPVPVVMDYVSFKEVLVMGKLFVFTHQLLRTLTGMPRESLIAMIYSSISGVEVSKEADEEILTHAQILGRLHARGFFDRYEEYKRADKLAKEIAAA